MLLRRVLIISLLAIITAIWCWIITALHGAWSFGIVEGYLDGGKIGGKIPLYPSLSVTYAEFFFLSIIAPFITFGLAIIWCSFAPQNLYFIGIFAAWMIGFWAGAENISFTFQIDYGATWGPGEALGELFFHPIVTPVSLIFGLFGTAGLTRPWRRKP